MRGMVCWTGFRATGVPFERAPRFAGKTKYNYVKLIKLALDSVTGFTTAPLRIATWLGMLISFGALLWILVVIGQFIWMGTSYRPAGYTFLAIAVLFLGGVQIFLIGLVGEYLGRTYEQVQGRPLYIVDELVGFRETRAVGGANGRLLDE